MNEQQFTQLRGRAWHNEAPAEILAAVELEPGLVTRGTEGSGQTILHSACGGGHVGLTRDLVDRQADVHQRCTTFGQDALMFASVSGHIPVMEFLLSRGADMTARNNDGDTALGCAALCDKLPAGKVLISRGSDLMTKNNNGKTGLDIFGATSNPPLSTEVKKQRCDELLAAFIEVKDIKNAVQAKENASLAAKIAVLKRATASMLFSEDFSDLVFVAGGERIPAHRIILAANSEHMGALLKGPWRENVDGQAVEIPMEQSAAAVRVLLRFVYTGEADEAGLSSPPVLMGVLDLSSRHLLPELKAACERRLVGSLTVPSVAAALVAAYLYDLTALKAACVEFIKANSFAVMLSSSFVALKTEHPAIWKELRVALGLPEEEEEEEEEKEQEEGPERKSARREV